MKPPAGGRATLLHVRLRVLSRLLLAAFLGAEAPAALGPRYGGELRVGVPDLPSSLVPGPAPGLGPRLAAGLVHETLVGLTSDGALAPALAASWTAVAEGREWALSIGESARFHDGRPVTAEDAVRSLRTFLRGPGAAAAALARALDGGAAFRARQAEDLPGLAALDSRRLALRLDAPAASALATLASPAAAITGAGGVGAGPFVPDLLVPGQRLVATAFAAHARGRPYLDRVRVTGSFGPEELATEAHAGRVDLAAGEPGLEALAASLLLILDPRRPPFDRPETRAAVAAAIDRAALVARLVPGGTASTDLLPPSLLRGPEPPRPPLEAPPSRLVLPDGSVVLAVSRDLPPPVSQRVLAHLTALGLRVRVTAMDAAAALAAPAELRLLAFAPEVPEPGLALEELSALAPSPRAALERLEEARRETDAPRRRALLAEAHDALRREGSIVALGHAPVRFGGRGRVHGARIDAAGRLVLEDAWVEP